MKRENAGLLFLRTFGAILFSILLVVLLLVIPVYNTAAAITKPKKLSAMAADVIKSVELTALIDLPETLEFGDFSMDAEATKALLESDTVKEVLGACTEQMLLAYTSGDPTVVFNEQTVEGVLADNTDQLTALLQQHVPETADLPVEKVQQQLTANLTAISQEVMEMLPPMEEIQQLTGADIKDKVSDKVGDDTADAVGDAMDQAGNAVGDAMEEMDSAMSAANETIALLQQIFATRTAYILYGVTALLALLILLCRYKNLNGLIWLGADGLIAGIPLLGLCLALTGSNLLLSLLPEMEIPTSIVTTVVNVLLGEVLVGAIILVTAGVLLIVAGAVYKAVRNKKAAKPATQVPLSPMM